MPPMESAVPLQAVAERIIARYLRRALNKDVDIVSGHAVQAARGIDIVCVAPDGARRSAKVKADPYFGTDAGKIGDRSLPFYRADTGSFAFEAVANAATREPGWMRLTPLCYRLQDGASFTPPRHRILLGITATSSQTTLSRQGGAHRRRSLEQGRNPS